VGFESAVAALAIHPERQVSWKALTVLKMLGKAAHAILPELLPLVQEGSPPQRLQVALTIVAIDSTDKKFLETTLPVLLRELYPSKLTEDPRGTIDRINRRRQVARLLATWPRHYPEVPIEGACAIMTGVAHLGLSGGTPLPPRTARLLTLGCKVNQYETQYVKEMLELNGIALAEDDQPADLCLSIPARSRTKATPRAGS
jgi:hypothetical protein